MQPNLMRQPILSQLLVYVRYVHEESLLEEFTFCRPLPTLTTGEQIFVMLNNFICQECLNWDWCTEIFSDGAQSVMGKHRNFVTWVQGLAPSAKWTHCMMYREALAAKKIPQPLKSVTQQAVQIINFIKARPLDAHLFWGLCQEMWSDLHHLLLHTKVRCLAQGRVLLCLTEVRERG